MVRGRDQPEFNMERTKGSAAGIRHNLSKSGVQWFTNNQNVARIILYGSRKPFLQEEALTIITTCVNHHI